MLSKLYESSSVVNPRISLGIPSVFRYFSTSSFHDFYVRSSRIDRFPDDRTNVMNFPIILPSHWNLIVHVYPSSISLPRRSFLNHLLIHFVTHGGGGRSRSQKQKLPGGTRTATTMGQDSRAINFLRAATKSRCVRGKPIIYIAARVRTRRGFPRISRNRTS